MSTLTHGRRGLWMAALLTAAIAVAAVLIAGGIDRGTASAGTDSFSGQCSTQGTVYFSPPVKSQPQQPENIVYSATGTCSGTLDGQSISNMPVKLLHAGQANASCTYAKTDAPGSGNIYFQNGVVIPYTFQFTDATTEIAFTYAGQQSGSAHGHGSFATQRTSPTDVLSQCGGDGATQVPMDMQLLTDSPLVSERHGGGGASGGRGNDGQPPKHSGTTAHSRRNTHHVRATR